MRFVLPAQRQTADGMIGLIRFAERSALFFENRSRGRETRVEGWLAGGQVRARRGLAPPEVMVKYGQNSRVLPDVAKLNSGLSKVIQGGIFIWDSPLGRPGQFFIPRTEVSENSAKRPAIH